MFICSFRASTLRFFSVIALAAVTLTALILLVPAYEDGDAAENSVGAALTVSFGGITTNEDRVAFLSQFGYTVSPEPIESVEVTIPTEFDRVFSGYNELQKAQGLDISRYRGKKVMRYTYEVSGYPDAAGKVCANLIVYKNRVIAGDICSADPAGFIHGFARPE